MLTSELIELGSIPFGKPHSFAFQVKNGGSTPAVIKRIVVGCTSCTTAQAKVSIIPANTTVPIDVVYTPGAIGPSKKRVSVIYDDEKELKLQFTADVHK